MEEKENFTGYYDSFGEPIFEGSEIEYFDGCYCNEGAYYEKNCKDTKSEDFIERAKKNGYTVKYEEKLHSGKLFLQMMKPCRGIVKWNQECVTYEPLVNSQDDFFNNSFLYLVSIYKEKGAYCKVIK